MAPAAMAQYTPGGVAGTTSTNITQIGGATQSATNPLFVEPTDGTAAAITGNHPISIRQSADGTNFVDSTHGGYSNLLQGNAALSTTNPLPVSPNGVAQASIVNVTAAVANVDTTIAFGASFTHAIIKTDTGASAIFVDLANGTATTADFKVDGGGALTYTGAPITGFHYIGSSASGNISYLAW